MAVAPMHVTTVTAHISNAKVWTTEWKEPWTGCFEDFPSCACACLCPCVQYAKNYTAVTNHSYGLNPEQAVSQGCGTCVCAALVWLVGTYFCGPIAGCVLGCSNRGNLRQKYGITTGDCADQCSDIIMHCFCDCCALSQEWREMKWRQEQPMRIAMAGGSITQGQVFASNTMMVASPGVVMVQPQIVSPGVVYAQAPQQQTMYAQPQMQQQYPQQMQQQQQQYPQQQQQYPQQQQQQPYGSAPPPQYGSSGPQYNSQPQYTNGYPQQQMQR